MIGYLLRRERDDARSAVRMAGVFSIMVLLGIAFATGTLPVGITADFARWYLIFPQIGLIPGSFGGYLSLLGPSRQDGCDGTRRYAWAFRAGRPVRDSRPDLVMPAMPPRKSAAPNLPA